MYAQTSKKNLQYLQYAYNIILFTTSSIVKYNSSSHSKRKKPSSSTRQQHRISSVQEQKMKWLLLGWRWWSFVSSFPFFISRPRAFTLVLCKRRGVSSSRFFLVSSTAVAVAMSSRRRFSWDLDFITKYLLSLLPCVYVVCVWLAVLYWGKNIKGRRRKGRGEYHIIREDHQDQKKRNSSVCTKGLYIKMHDIKLGGR